MERADALARLDRALLRAFSRRTAARLEDYLPVRLASGWLDGFLADNVAKEVRKDALVIRQAAAALAAGLAPGTPEIAALLDACRAIDQDFLARVAGIPATIVLRYDEIEPIRHRRIERLLGAAYGILAAWRDRPSLRAALQDSHPRADLERLLRELLLEYAQETRALSRSLRLPVLLAPLLDRLGQALYEVMSEQAHALAREAAAVAYRRPARP